MSVVVMDDGFHAVGGEPAALTLADLQVSDTAGHTIDLDGCADVAALTGFFDRIAMIRVSFPTFADGRGFSVAARLRQLGYRGHLRAVGHLLADQYPNARRSGFDAVEISDALAARQPEAQWLAFADWGERSYQARLRRAKDSGGGDAAVPRAA